MQRDKTYIHSSCKIQSDNYSIDLQAVSSTRLPPTEHHLKPKTRSNVVVMSELERICHRLYGLQRHESSVN